MYLEIPKEMRLVRFCSGQERIGVFVVANLLGRGGQRKEESSAGAEFDFPPGSAAVGLNDVLYDRQAKAGASSFSRTRLVNPIEAFEDALRSVPSDAGAKVAHEKLNLVWARSVRQRESVVRTFRT